MSITKQANPAMTRLALAIGEAIQRHTLTSPMTAEDVIGVIAFCAGSAIGQKEAQRQHKVRELRQMAVANIDLGIQSAQQASGPRLILPT